MQKIKHDYIFPYAKHINTAKKRAIRMRFFIYNDLSPRVGKSIQTRQNSFTAIRIALAMAVLFTHAFSLTASGRDPITLLLAGRGQLPSVGQFAVNGFFAISGFLIASSLSHRTVISFAISRICRVYPAAVLCILLTVFLIGPALTKLEIAEYFSTSSTYAYLQNMMLWRIQYTLPGLFETNAYPASVNGSLWTLPAEVRCYVLAALVLLFGISETRARANIFLIGLLVLGYINYRSLPFFGLSPSYGPLGAHFIAGALLWINRGWIPHSWPLAILATFILSTGLIVPTPAGLLTPAWAYLVLFVAERTFAVKVQKLGDPSYGIYLYAFPVQQAVWSLGQPAWLNITLAAPITILLGYASWWLVERRSVAAANALARVLPTKLTRPPLQSA